MNTSGTRFQPYIHNTTKAENPDCKTHTTCQSRGACRTVGAIMRTKSYEIICQPIFQDFYGIMSVDHAHTEPKQPEFWEKQYLYRTLRAGNYTGFVQSEGEFLHYMIAMSPIVQYNMYRCVGIRLAKPKYLGKQEGSDSSGSFRFIFFSWPLTSHTVCYESNSYRWACPKISLIARKERKFFPGDLIWSSLRFLHKDSG